MQRYRSQIEEQQSANENLNRQLKDQSEEMAPLRAENQRLCLLVREQTKELEEVRGQNRVAFEEMNKQLEGTLRTRMEGEIKELHTRYLKVENGFRNRKYNS